MQVTLSSFAGCEFHGFDEDDETGGARVQGAAAAFQDSRFLGLSACALGADFARDGNFASSTVLARGSTWIDNTPDVCPSSNCTLYASNVEAIVAGRGLDSNRIAGEHLLTEH